MAHVPDYNFPLFDQVAAQLRRGNNVVVFTPPDYCREVHGPDALTVPKAMSPQELHKWVRQAMAYQLAWICRNADIIALRPGWEKSRGARARGEVAGALDRPISGAPDTLLPKPVRTG